MAVSKSDLKFYFTSSESSAAQSAPRLSLGGYPSTTPFCQSTTLSTLLRANETGAYLASTLGSPSAILLRDEIATVTGSGTSLTLSRGVYDTEPRFHISGDPVYNISDQRIFNNSLNAEGKQYRCIAVRNEHATDSFNNMTFYIKRQSRNVDCSIRIAIEVPEQDLYEGTATSGSSITLIDTVSIGDFAEEDVVGRVLRMVIEVGESTVTAERPIASYDELTGTFTFITALTYPAAAGTTYRIENSPAQRLSSGLLSPVVDTDYVSSFQSATDIASGIDIDMGMRTNGANLLPNEVIYIWMERTLAENAEAFDNNRVVITASYTP